MNGMLENQENQNGQQNLDLQCLPSLCRGIYNRVAQKVGCDPSYVSRVARGERTSEVVSQALRAEIQLTWTRVREGNGNGNGEVTRKTQKRKAHAASV